MSQPLPLSSPFCNFFCGPATSDMNNQLCHAFCRNNENCAITPNILYTFSNGIFNDRGLFITGINTIIRDNASDLAFRLALYQQLPWIIMFLLLLFVLAYVGVIGIVTVIILGLFAILLIFLFIYFSYQDTIDTIQNTTTAVTNQLNTDLQNARTQIGTDLRDPLIGAINSSQVPCGCSCPLGNTR